MYRELVRYTKHLRCIIFLGPLTYCVFRCALKEKLHGSWHFQIRPNISIGFSSEEERSLGDYVSGMIIYPWNPPSLSLSLSLSPPRILTGELHDGSPGGDRPDVLDEGEALVATDRLLVHGAYIQRSILQLASK
jgi:hypothetical protein